MEIGTRNIFYKSKSWKGITSDGHRQYPIIAHILYTGSILNLHSITRHCDMTLFILLENAKRGGNLQDNLDDATVKSYLS